MEYLLKQADMYLEAADNCRLRNDIEGEKIATKLAIRRLQQYASTCKNNN